MDSLTEAQEQCLLQIVHHIREKGEPPTRRELQQVLRQKSTNGVNQILDSLQKKGYIKIDPPSRKRNIVVLYVPNKQLLLFEDMQDTPKN
jgi:SOS-response transcriptional repressor LexA